MTQYAAALVTYDVGKAIDASHENCSDGGCAATASAREQEDLFAQPQALLQVLAQVNDMHVWGD